MKYLVVLLTSFMVSATTLASTESYSPEDIIYFLNFNQENAEEMNYQNCEEMPFLQKQLCKKVEEQMASALAQVFPEMNGGELVYHESIPRQDLSSDVDFRAGRITLRLNQDIRFAENGMDIQNVYYPQIAKVNLQLDADGGGRLREHNVDIFDNDLDYDVDIDGHVDVEVVAAFTLNPRVFRNDNVTTVVLEPKFRLFATSSDADLDYDVDSSFFNLIAHGLQTLGSFGQIIYDFAFDWNAIEEDFIDFGIHFATTFTDFFLNLDDASGDEFFEIASGLTERTVDHQLDRETERLLYQQELAINQQIQQELGTDANGLIQIPLPNLEGEAFATLMPALALL